MTTTAPPAPEPLLPPLRDPLFDNLRDGLAGQQAPAAVQHAVMAAFARQHGAARRPWWRRLGATGWGLAACGTGGLGAMALLLAVMMAGRPPGDDDAGRGDFIALDTVERIEQDPAPRMLATMVPRSSLAALGVAVSPDNAGDMVKAEMLVGADGSPLALRLASE